MHAEAQLSKVRGAMLKNSRLATRVGFGFFSIVAIATVLGAFAALSMSQVRSVAAALSGEHVPNVSIANDVERWSFMTMYAARGYVLGGDEESRSVAEDNLEQVKAHLEAARQQATAHDNKPLLDSVEAAIEQSSTYERRLQETAVDINEMKREQKVFRGAADGYMTACDKFLEAQLGANPAIAAPAGGGSPDLKATGGGGQGVDNLALRLRKVQLCINLASVGNEIRSATWQSIASNQLERMASTQAEFDRVKTTLNELESLCRDPDELKRIEECRSAGDQFNESMSSYLVHWRARLKKDTERSIAAQAVLDAARSAARLNIDAIELYSKQASDLLGRASVTLTIGLVAGSVIALVLSVLITSGITRPLEEITRVARLASSGETGELPPGDAGGELGVLATTFRQMNAFYTEMGEKGKSIAEGDYSVQIVPRSENDMLGRSFAEMTRTLRAVANVAKSVAAGNYSTEVFIKGERDELGRAINQMIARLRQTMEEAQVRDWIKSGVAELSVHMRGEHTVSSLAQCVVSFLAEYLETPMAALYVLEESGVVLTLQASFAEDSGRQPRQIRLGEGIVGQCALEGHHLEIRNIPEDYFHIGSSLGSSRPTDILAIPFIHGGRLSGVLEFASFQPFSDSTMTLLSNVMESIAIAFNAAQSRERMQSLLDQLQVQTEELQAQTEELESQQQELKASNEELEEQSEELRASNEELEEKTQALERQKIQLDERRLEVERGKQDIEQKARELELANRYKSEFLANMSHELRTPLNSLLILARMLASNDEGNLTDQQVTSARIIYGGGQDLLFLINEILDLSKVEAGMMEVHREQMALDEIVDRLHQLFTPTAVEKGLEFRITREPGVPASIITDAQRLEQILRNLLSNAFKFTAEGVVHLEIHCPPSTIKFQSPSLSEESAVGFSIHDAGPGIPEDKREAIFEAFQQADGSTSRKYGGTGLGLSISKALAHLLSGEIHLSSQVGVGSTFTLYLPLASMPGAISSMTDVKSGVVHSEVRNAGVRETPPATAPAEREFVADDRNDVAPGDRSVLFIEDDRRFVQILMEQARRKGFKCLAAASGSGGLALANQYKPSAIILDLGLPDMDGGTVLDALKYNLGTRHIPVHIVSARDKSTEILRKGALGYITKPVDTESIDMALDKIESIIKCTAKRILVIEDDENSRSAIEKLLSTGRVEIVGTGTGTSAIQLLESGTFDCIILDLGLPDMSGFELLKSLEACPNINLPPTIIYTGKELSRDEIRELGRYTTNVVVKGANSPERLLDETSLFLHTVAANLPRMQRQMLRMLHDPERMLQGRKVLLVDDDLRNSFALSKVLERAELNVLMAENGQAALDVLEREEGVELVLMDIMMPVMDGYEAIRKIREQHRYKELPIVALTAKAMQDDRAKCIDAGANDYLPKPLDTDKLLSLMRVLLYQ